MARHSGYNLEACRNCNKAVVDSKILVEKIIAALEPLNLEEEMANKFNSLLYHYVPRISIAGCPNGCSQPKIKDFGISGYLTPVITEEKCVECEACIWACQEESITLRGDGVAGVIIDPALCLSCGDCLKVCPTGYLAPGERGWQLLLGGRVGRHPRFAESVGSALTDEQVVDWIRQILSDYLQDSKDEERITHYLERTVLAAGPLSDPPA